MTDVALDQVSSTGGATGINIDDIGNGSVVTTNVMNSTFRNPKPAIPMVTIGGLGCILVGTNENGAVNNINISNNTLSGLHIPNANAGTIAVNCIAGTCNGTINANNITGNGGGNRRAIEVVSEPEPTLGEVGSVDVTISNNIINRFADREAVFVDLRTETQNSEIVVSGNQIGQLAGFEGQVGGTREAIEIRSRGNEARTVNATVVNNNVRASITGDQFLDIDSEAGAGAPAMTVNATVTGNTFNNPNAAPNFTIDAETESASASMCLNVSGNTLNHTGGTNNGTIRIAETANVLNVTQTSAADVAAVNGIPAGNVNVAGTPQFSQPPCALPSG